jgi:hypothetical protein
MSELVNGRIRLNEDETRRFLHMYHNPNEDAIRKRDAFINSSAEKVTHDEDGMVSSVEIPDIEFPSTAPGKEKS